MFHAGEHIPCRQSRLVRIKQINKYLKLFKSHVYKELSFRINHEFSSCKTQRYVVKKLKVYQGKCKPENTYINELNIKTKLCQLELKLFPSSQSSTSSKLNA